MDEPKAQEAANPLGWCILELMGQQYYSGAALYCVTPTTEQIARAVALRAQPEPVQRWELPAMPADREEEGLSEDDDIAF